MGFALRMLALVLICFVDAGLLLLAFLPLVYGLMNFCAFAGVGPFVYGFVGGSLHSWPPCAHGRGAPSSAFALCSLAWPSGLPHARHRVER